MKRFGAIALVFSIVGAQALAVGNSEAGFESFDTSLEGVQVNEVVSLPDYETIFVKQDKDFPDQVGVMIASEKQAWDEHAKKLDKSWWNQGIEYCRSYRYGYRHSFYNGYRYANRNSHGYSYSNYGYNNHHRSAYEYSYGHSYRNHWANNISISISSTMNYGYRNGYQNAYRHGYSHGRHNHWR